MTASLKDVPVKVRKKLPFQDTYEEYTPRTWAGIARQIGQHIKAGGSVVVEHRRLETPVPGRRGSGINGYQSLPANYDVVEVCDVEFQ